MSEPASISLDIASRYSQAVLDIANETKSLAKLEKDIATLRAALNDSSDLVALIHSPFFSRDDQMRAITAIADAMKLSEMVKNTLGLMATKRRLFVVPALLSRLSTLIADQKGDVEAEVTSAKALTKAQTESLSKVIAKAVGKNVNISAVVDEKIIGGLVVKVGSKMIDTSIRSKLNSLQSVMKEVG